MVVVRLLSKVHAFTINSLSRFIGLPSFSTAFRPFESLETSNDEKNASYAPFEGSDRGITRSHTNWVKYSHGGFTDICFLDTWYSEALTFSSHIL